MQLLYGRDKINYKTLSKSNNITPASESVLINDYIGYEFVKNQDIYSDKSNEPYAITYCVTNLDGYLNDEKLLVSKSGRNLAYASPSKYAHIRLDDIEDDSFKEGFFDIFKYVFIDSRDSEKYKYDEVDSYKFNLIELEKTEPLSKEAIKSILYLLFDNYRAISDKVYVIIDKDGDEYNCRSLDVIRQIYENIPYFMRKIIGFSSYASTNQKFSNRIKLVAMTRENAEYKTEFKVDLLNLNFEKISKRTKANTKYIVDYILDCDNKSEFFEYLDEENKKNKLNLARLYTICKFRTLFKDIDGKQKISSWIHNIINPNELEEAIFYFMVERIEKELNNENFNDYLKAILSEEESICEDYLNENKKLYNFLLFEDILSVDYPEYDIKVDLDVDYIVNWWNENILPILKSKYNNRELKQILEKEVKNLEILDLQGRNYAKLKKSINENINKLHIEDEPELAIDADDVDNKAETKLDTDKGLNLEKIDAADKENSFDLTIKETSSSDIDLAIKKDISIDIDFNNLNRINNLKELNSILIKDKKPPYSEEEINLLLDKIEKLIYSYDIKDINDRDNINCGGHIYDIIYNGSEANQKGLFELLIDRTIEIDLNNINQTCRAIDDKIEFINSQNLSFDLDLYEFNVVIKKGSGDESLNDKKANENTKENICIKFIYLDELKNYLKSKKGFFNRLIHKFYSFDEDFLEENKNLIDSINKY